MFPYDLSAESRAALGPLSRPFFVERLPVWLGVTLGYVGFWHITLYHLQLAQRPMLPTRTYSWDKVAHNVWFTVCGIVIWVGFENVFAFLWSTGRLSYLSDAHAFTTPSGFARFVLGLIAVPLWRDFHFYFAHRLLHFKPLYRFVHSLHHRNTDVEPFSGLCMHPVEQFYYFSCILPSVFLVASPFHFVWNGIHLLLSPAAAHSGWEDHFQADNFHYMHHRYFECNYAGFGSAALDVIFGTFTDKFKEPAPAKARADVKATLRSPPSMMEVLYLLLSLACVGLWLHAAQRPGFAPKGSEMALALLAGFGPAIVPVLLVVLTEGRKGLLDPFSRHPLWQNAAHVITGVVCCCVPITAVCYLSL
jgi:sterol desaturase/sphingolipid hydroxylase (fatty acid hydroxylase superfamily)